MYPSYIQFLSPPTLENKWHKGRDVCSFPGPRTVPGTENSLSKHWLNTRMTRWLQFNFLKSLIWRVQDGSWHSGGSSELKLLVWELICRRWPPSHWCTCDRTCNMVQRSGWWEGWNHQRGHTYSLGVWRATEHDWRATEHDWGFCSGTHKTAIQVWATPAETMQWWLCAIFCVGVHLFRSSGWPVPGFRTLESSPLLLQVIEFMLMLNWGKAGSTLLSSVPHHPPPLINMLLLPKASMGERPSTGQTFRSYRM